MADDAKKDAGDVTPREPVVTAGPSSTAAAGRPHVDEKARGPLGMSARGWLGTALGALVGLLIGTLIPDGDDDAQVIALAEEQRAGLAALDSRIGAVAARVDAVAVPLGELRTGVTGVGTVLSRQVEDTRARNETILAAIARETGNVAPRVEATVAALEERIDALTATLTEVTAGQDRTVAAIRTGVSEVASGTSGIADEVAALSEDVSGLSEDVSGLSEDVSGLSGEVSGVTGSVDGIDARLETVGTAFEDATARLDLAIGQFDLIASRIDLLGDRIDALDAGATTPETGDVAVPGTADVAVPGTGDVAVAGESEASTAIGVPGDGPASGDGPTAGVPAIEQATDDQVEESLQETVLEAADEGTPTTGIPATAPDTADALATSGETIEPAGIATVVMVPLGQSATFGTRTITLREVVGDAARVEPIGYGVQEVPRGASLDFRDGCTVRVSNVTPNAVTLAARGCDG